MQQVKAPQQQQAAQQADTLPIREMQVQELIALAIYRRRRMMEQGKSSLRVVVPLPASIIPPPSGQYTTAIGEVSVKSIFKDAEGRWICVVKLPSQEGFKFKDLLPNPPSQPSNPQK
jgi:hypothetical protein